MMMLMRFLWGGSSPAASEWHATPAQIQTAEAAIGVLVDASRPALRQQPAAPQAATSGKASKSSEWDYPRIRKEFERVLGRIREAPIIHEPFPHIEVPELLSDTFYAALMDELPPITDYHKVQYAGTAPTYDVLDTDQFNTSTPLRVPEECRAKDTEGKRCFFKTRQLHDDGYKTGLAFKAGVKLERRYPLWNRMYQLFHSLNFTRTLVDKFSLEDGRGIPMWKRARWNLTDGPLLNSAALRIEPSRYHLAPHVDIMEKLVTWQFFHPVDFSVADRKVGTRFYRPKAGLNMNVDDVKNPQWMDYDLFDEVGEQRVVPNYFFSFTPSNFSWHGVSINPDQLEGVSEYSRRTFLGFITAGDTGFHPFRKPEGNVYLD